MMTTTLETPQSIKSQENLDKAFNVLFTPTMYTQIVNHSKHLSISKGALIRIAMEDYLHKREEDDALDYLRRMDAEQS